MSGDLASFVEEQRAQGKTDAQIEQGLVSTGWDPSAVKSALTPIPTAVTASAAPSPDKADSVKTNHVSASQIFSVIGMLLVVVAYASFLLSTWQDLSPLAKFIASAAPTAVLFLTSILVGKQSSLNHVRDATGIAGLLALPVAIGAFLYQFNVYHEFNSLLLFISILASLPVTLLFDYVLKRPGTAALTIIDGCGAIIFLFAYLEASDLIGAAVTLLIAIIALALAVAAKQRQDERHQRPYQTVGVVALALAVPSAVFTSFNHYFSANGLYDSWWLAGGLLSGVLLLLSSQVTGQLFRPAGGVEWKLQRFLQLSALLLLFGSMAIGSWESDSSQLAVNLVLGGLFIIYGLVVGVNLLFFGSVIGTGLGLLLFLLQYLDNSLATLVALFVLGFGSIGLSIILGRSKFARSGLYSATLANRLGVISDEAAEQLDLTPHRTRWWLVLLIIFGGPLVLGAVFSVVDSVRYRSQPVTSPYPEAVEAPTYIPQESPTPAADGG